MAKKTENNLEKHPEVTEKAKDLFNYGKRPIIEESVNRGDVRETTPSAQDISYEDVLKLSKFAKDLIDPNTLKYDLDTALTEAVSMAIGTMDNGKWQGKIDVNTCDIIIKALSDSLTASNALEISEKKGQSSNDYNMSGEGMGKEAGAKDPLPPKGKVVDNKGKAKPTALKSMKVQDRQRLQKQLNSGKDVVVVKDATTSLDKIAGILQKKGDDKLAYSLDTVANTLEGLKEADDLHDLANQKREVNNSAIAKLVHSLQSFVKNYGGNSAGYDLLADLQVMSSMAKNKDVLTFLKGVNGSLPGEFMTSIGQVEESLKGLLKTLESVKDIQPGMYGENLQEGEM